MKFRPIDYMMDIFRFRAWVRKRKNRKMPPPNWACSRGRPGGDIW